MTNPRVIETNEGIQSEITAAVFDHFAAFMRDKGWNGVDEMIASQIRGGKILEIGPGPGYVGLELIKKLGTGSLTGCEISPAMIKLTQKNAAQYQIPAKYVQGNGMQMPFENESFDCVISNGSMHEWENPLRVFWEIHRVLKPGGHYCITDLRRDAALWKKWFVYTTTRPKEMRPGLVTSLNTAYTLPKICGLLQSSPVSAAYRNVQKHSPKFPAVPVFSCRNPSAAFPPPGRLPDNPPAYTRRPASDSGVFFQTGISSSLG